MLGSELFSLDRRSQCVSLVSTRYTALLLKAADRIRPLIEYHTIPLASPCSEGTFDVDFLEWLLVDLAESAPIR